MASMVLSLSDKSDKMETQQQPVEKKKLCRVSKGLANSRTLLTFNGTNSTKTQSSGDVTLAENIAREIGGAELVEISVVRGNGGQNFHCDRTADVLDKDNQTGCTWQNNKDLFSNELSTIPEECQTFAAEEKTQTKRVAFSDNLTVHSFEIDKETSSDVENDVSNEQFDEISINENDDKMDSYHSTTSITSSSETSSSCTPMSPAILPKKVPLRRLIYNHVARACSRANMLKSFVSGSFRNPSSYSNTKTKLERTRSLPDSSIRHSFIKSEDHNRTDVDLVIPLGDHYVPNSVQVKTSGDGRKIKVCASRKRSLGKADSVDRSVGDYQEWFYMPKAIVPRQTSAVVDQNGYLKIKAPFEPSRSRIKSACS